MQEASRKPQIRSIARLPGLLLELAFRRLLDLLAAANRMLLASTSTARIRRLSRKPVWSRGFCLTDDHKKTDSPCRSMYLFLGAATAEEGLLTSKKTPPYNLLCGGRRVDLQRCCHFFLLECPN